MLEQLFLLDSQREMRYIETAKTEMKGKKHAVQHERKPDNKGLAITIHIIVIQSIETILHISSRKNFCRLGKKLYFCKLNLRQKAAEKLNDSVAQ